MAEAEGRRQDATGAPEDIRWPMAVRTNKMILHCSLLLSPCRACIFPKLMNSVPSETALLLSLLAIIQMRRDFTDWKSLSNPSRARDDGTLVAVTFISFGEYGWKPSHRHTIHQRACDKWSTRGGLDSIMKASAVGERVLKPYLLWT